MNPYIFSKTEKLENKFIEFIKFLYAYKNCVFCGDIHNDKWHNIKEYLKSPEQLSKEVYILYSKVHKYFISKGKNINMSLYHKLYNLDLLANIKIEYYIKIIYPEKLTFYSPSEFKKKNGYLTYKNMMDRNEFNKMKYYIFICCNTFNKKLPKCLTFYIYKFFVD